MLVLRCHARLLLWHRRNGVIGNEFQAFRVRTRPLASGAWRKIAARAPSSCRIDGDRPSDHGAAGMEASSSWIVGILMLALPAGWLPASPAACHESAVLHGPPGATAEECSATFSRGASELTVIVWRPGAPRAGGAMVPVEAGKGRLLGSDVTVNRTAQFMGTRQEVLVTALTLQDPRAQILIYARKTDAADFQEILDHVSLAK
jgi:hypothetical protein